jgi:hypothetical protein
LGHLDIAWRFESHWTAPSEALTQRWLGVLERLGVKAALDQQPVAAQADVWIGGVTMTLGFAEDWHWHHAV